jgi:hypothetical protein
MFEADVLNLTLVDGLSESLYVTRFDIIEGLFREIISF